MPSLEDDAEMDPRVKAALDQAEHPNMGQRKFEKLNSLCANYDGELNKAAVLRLGRFITSKTPADVKLHADVLQRCGKLLGRTGVWREHPEVTYNQI